MYTSPRKLTKSGREGVSDLQEVQTQVVLLLPLDKLVDPVQIRNLQSVRYIHQGKTKRYEFPPAGTLPVNREDVPELLAKLSRGGGCCGYFDPGGRPLFTEVV